MFKLLIVLLLSNILQSSNSLFMESPAWKGSHREFSLAIQARNDNSGGEECPSHDDYPYECWKSGCVYDCLEGSCLTHPKRGNCASDCVHYCFDPCQCRKNKCFYDARNNRCLNGFRGGKIRACTPGFFNGTDLYRRGPVYVRAGIYCDNSNGPTSWFGIPKLEGTGLSFNLGGGKDYTSKVGIRFKKEHGHIRYSDPWKTRKTTRNQNVAAPHDKELYVNLIKGDKSKQKAGVCITYFVDKRLFIPDWYEFCIYTQEPVHSHNRKDARSFNVRFQDMQIMQEIDLYELTGKVQTAVEICTLFKIFINPETERKMIHLHGYDPMSFYPLPSNDVPVQFCYGRCDHDVDRGYMIGAFSIARRAGRAEGKGKETSWEAEVHKSKESNEGDAGKAVNKGNKAESGEDKWIYPDHSKEDSDEGWY